MNQTVVKLKEAESILDEVMLMLDAQDEYAKYRMPEKLQYTRDQKAKIRKMYQEYKKVATLFDL